MQKRLELAQGNHTGSPEPSHRAHFNSLFPWPGNAAVHHPTSQPRDETNLLSLSELTVDKDQELCLMNL